ncbi:hypothetical protein AB8Z76_23450 [Xanthomonas phaseoli pv. phaseoli]|nr:MULTISPECIES: hypothetical protein [Xanthomonas]MDM4805282.1 hypothetical protein [Xanthomonas phaseoli pv. phaseoli]UZB12329.1 hypothetical protein OM952_22075 [Xanthomonas phaseoli pv. phaseoli]UZB16487.1 hypothetical protein OM949_21725 [Xanthomonas phaseoli pv. phaseoli]UZB20639.1 hypothetical protein OM947_21835 [Xanthomonas phaseoli pv. phaseoli]UZB24927.1 hypothetical protein OM954_22530 [Xanthomonas phaseoli pv. phaseoli]
MTASRHCRHTPLPQALLLALLPPVAGLGPARRALAAEAMVDP